MTNLIFSTIKWRYIKEKGGKDGNIVLLVWLYIANKLQSSGNIYIYVKPYSQ